MIRWVKDHAALLVLLVVVLVAMLAVLFSRRSGKAEALKALAGDLAKEKKIIDAKADIAKEQATLGAYVAREKIWREYGEQIKALDEDARKKVDELAEDPEALVERLLRGTL